MKAIGKGEGMHDICNLFGAALSRARRELGLTQIELAEKLGTTDRSISDLERGKTNPKLDTVAHFSRSLGISIDALIGIVPKGDVPSCVRTFFAGMSAEEARSPKDGQSRALRGCGQSPRKQPQACG